MKQPTVQPLTSAQLDAAAEITEEDRVLAQTEWRRKVKSLPLLLDALPAE